MRKQASKVRYTHVDLDRSGPEYRDYDPNVGAQFLHDYLLPGYRRMMQRRKRTAVVIENSLAVTFMVDHITFGTIKETPTEIWRVRFGRVMTEDLEREVAVKVLSAFRIWGYPKAHALWLYSKDKPMLLEVHLCGVLPERVKGLSNAS